MTDYHPITPPLELVNQWCHEDGDEIKTSPRWYEIVCIKAARWGADQELEACCADVQMGLGPNEADWLRSVRRPKPLSLKKVALEAQQRMWNGGVTRKDWELVRRALESLPD